MNMTRVADKCDFYVTYEAIERDTEWGIEERREQGPALRHDQFEATQDAPPKVLGYERRGSRFQCENHHEPIAAGKYSRNVPGHGAQSAGRCVGQSPTGRCTVFLGIFHREANFNPSVT